ncbi:MAG TPA: histidinol dehydrogenase, partial [Woeseiaceae bacterium]
LKAGSRPVTRMELKIHNWHLLEPLQRRDLLQRPALRDDGTVQDGVRAIIDHVRKRGNAALKELTQRYDGVTIETPRVSEAEFAAAERSVPNVAIKAIQLAIDNVRRFHEARPPSDYEIETMPGVHCQRIAQPIDAVGLYVPAGSAPLPSAAVMLTVPAAIAGCPRRVLCTPPRRDGSADPAVLVAARRGGVNDVYKVGGAQAIAAMAYGTETILKVNKIFGPGNAWVTAAKTMVAGDADGAAIDMPAGPSEVLIIADEQATPEFVAADLLSQAEHGSDSQVILVTTSQQLAERAISEVKQQLALLPRRDIAMAALQSCQIIVAADIADAIAISNEYAPEHLLLQVRDPRAALPAIRNAGSVFLGDWSPESVGDYCSGTNHVLPTYGSARSFSGLSVDQFMRHMTVQELSEDGLRSIAPAVLALAGLEGLDAHAAAVSRRVQPRSDNKAAP